MSLRAFALRLRARGPIWAAYAVACPVGVLLALVWLAWHGTLLYARALGFWRDGGSV